MPIMDLTRNIMHITSMTSIFLNCVLNRNCKCKGQKQCNMDQTLIWINHWFLIDIKVNYCSLRSTGGTENNF